MILRSNGRILNIDILRRSRPESVDYEDGNWLETEIKIEVPGFKGFYGTNIRSDDFEYFYQDLEKFKLKQIGKVQFTTFEDGLCLEGVSDVNGNIKWKGIAKSQWGGSCLTFIIETDYLSIDSLINQLQKILEKYPVVGKAN